MAATQLTGKQIRDSSIQRVDVDTTTSGAALITKLIAGTNIAISSTGVDAGTGDVTLNVPTAAVSTAGVLSNSTQSISGVKTFLDGLNMGTTTTTYSFAGGSNTTKVAFKGNSSGATDYSKKIIAGFDDQDRVVFDINNAGRLNLVDYTSAGAVAVLYSGYNPAATNSLMAGHYAFGATNQDGNFNTINTIVSETVSRTPSAMSSQISLSYMDSVNTSSTYSQPNKTISFGASGVILPSIPIAGCTNLTATNGDFSSNVNTATIASSGLGTFATLYVPGTSTLYGKVAINSFSPNASLTLNVDGSIGTRDSTNDKTLYISPSSTSGQVDIQATNFAISSPTTLALNPSGGSVKVGSLTGTGTEMVTVTSTGVLGRTTMPGGGDAYLAGTQTFTGANTFNNSAFTINGASPTLLINNSTSNTGTPKLLFGAAMGKAGIITTATGAWGEVNLDIVANFEDNANAPTVAADSKISISSSGTRINGPFAINGTPVANQLTLYPSTGSTFYFNVGSGYNTGTSLLGLNHGGANKAIIYSNAAGSYSKSTGVRIAINTIDDGTPAATDGTNDKLVILPTGTVGVGTASPGTVGTGGLVGSTDLVLDVVGSSSQNSFIRVLGGAGATKGGLVIGNNDSGKDYGQFTFDNATNAFKITQNYTSGYLGLGANGRSTDLQISAATGDVTINTLAGTGSRMVVTSSTGVLSSQTIPSGGGDMTLAGAQTVTGVKTFTGIPIIYSATNSTNLTFDVGTDSTSASIIAQNSGTGVPKVLVLNSTSGNVKVPSLAGTGSRMVVADSTGQLVAQPMPITRSITSISANTGAGSATNTDYIYYISNGSTLTLPTAVGNTNRYTVMRTGTSIVPIATTSSQTINGQAAPLNLTVQYATVDLMSDGANWFIH